MNPAHRRRYVLVVLAALCSASIGGAHAAGLSVTSQRLTVSQNATSVTCIAQVAMVSGNAFSPQTVTITPGCSVRWTNNDLIPHDTTSNPAGLWASPLLTQGQSFTRVFNSAGTFNYRCTLHANMTGSVVVNP